MGTELEGHEDPQGDRTVDERRDGGGRRTSSSTRSTRETLHAKLVEALRAKIYSKEWPVRSKIPSEHELMAHFQVARGTVRRALKVLVDEGLLVQVRGSGTYVAEPGISHPAGVRPLSFAGSLREQGKDFTTKVIEKWTTRAPADVALELGVAPGDEVMFMRRVRSVEGEPVMCQESWLNLGACPGLLDIDYTVEPLFDACQRCSGHKIKTSQMRYSARTAGGRYAALLSCGENAALLLLEQVISFEDGTVVEWSNTWFRPGQSIVGTAIQPG